MNLRHVLSVMILALLVGLAIKAARAEEVIEAWRGPLEGYPTYVSVDPTDGSCWVAEWDADEVIHLAEDGTELWRGGNFGFGELLSISVNPTDGSCWVAKLGDMQDDNPPSQVIHLAQDGTELLRVGTGIAVMAVSANATDGSCWVALGSGGLLHLSEDGTELLRVTAVHPYRVSVNAADGSCWVVDGSTNEVSHLAEDGTELARVGGFGGGDINLSVNPRDGSCWLGRGDETVHLAEDGTELWRSGLKGSFPSVNPADGSCWVADQYNRQIIHLGPDGAELWRGGGFLGPYSVSANSADGSCWVADAGNAQVVHLVIPGWQPSVFYDVPWEFWTFAEVGACVEAGIVGGYDDGLYHGERTVTRGQMSVFVSRGLAGGDEGVPDFAGTPTFPDVDADHWALDYVEYVVAQNIVGGYEDGTYHPEREVTRGQMSIYVARAMVAPTTSVLADYVPAEPRNFPDVTTDHWAYTYVEYCVEQGIVGGFLDGTYRPDTVVTRDQMAVYVARAFELTM
jgi:DNA-binding beta-propeller fold protein YncE